MSISTINKQALKIFDNIIVAISGGNQKNHLFTADERITCSGKWSNRFIFYSHFSQTPQVILY